MHRPHVGLRRQSSQDLPKWRDSILRAALLAVVLLTAEGFALGMTGGFIAIRSDLRAFVFINELPAQSPVAFPVLA